MPSLVRRCGSGLPVSVCLPLLPSLLSTMCLDVDWQVATILLPLLSVLCSLSPPLALSTIVQSVCGTVGGGRRSNPCLPLSSLSRSWSVPSAVISRRCAADAALSYSQLFIQALPLSAAFFAFFSFLSVSTVLSITVTVTTRNSHGGSVCWVTVLCSTVQLPAFSHSFTLTTTTTTTATATQSTQSQWHCSIVFLFVFFFFFFLPVHSLGKSFIHSVSEWICSTQSPHWHTSHTLPWLATIHARCTFTP